MSSIEYGFDNMDYWINVHTENPETYKKIKETCVEEFRKDEDRKMQSIGVNPNDLPSD